MLNYWFTTMSLCREKWICLDIKLSKKSAFSCALGKFLHCLRNILYTCDRRMSKWRPHLCLKLFVCLCDMTLLKCVCVHVSACRLNSLCTICLTQQTNVDKRGRVTGDSFTTEIIMAAQFCSATYAWPWVYAAICLCWVISCLPYTHFCFSSSFSNSPFLLDDVHSAWCNVLASTN